MKHLLELQHQLQTDSFKYDPLLLEGEERIEFIRWNVLALEDELHEMLQECGWKPWSSSWHVNEGPALNELVDALHFFMNLLMAVAPRGATIEQLDGMLKDGYLHKREVNAKRQEDGYDGVTNKCRGCKRDLAEVQLEIVQSNGVRMAYCPCGAVISENLDLEAEEVPTQDHTEIFVGDQPVKTIQLPCSHPMPLPAMAITTIACECGKTWKLRRRYAGRAWDAHEVVTT